MKILALLLALSQAAFGLSYPGRLDTASTNVTTSHASGQKIDFGASYRPTSIFLHNGSATEIGVYCQASSTAPSGSIHFYVPAGFGMEVTTDWGLIRYCFFPSKGSTITSGVISGAAVTKK